MSASIPTSPKPRVVVIGGGFAGINLVNKLRHSGMQVVMLDKNNHHTFQPLLYQVATSGLEAGSIAYPIRKLFRKQKNFHYRMAEVLEVIPAQKQVRTSIGSISYDYLVVATGSETNFFNMADVEANAMSLKSVSEAIDLRHLILQAFEEMLLTDDPKESEGLMNFVMAGGGPTGVELAGALSELRKKVLPRDYPELDLTRMRIIILDPGTRVLAAMSEESSKKALKYLQDFGVEVRLGVGVKSYDGKVATLSNDEKLPTRTLIWAAGVRGKVIEGFDKALVARGNRIMVDEFNRVKGFEDIFCIGDVSAQETKKYPKGLPMLAPVAMQQGRALAKNLIRLNKREKMEPFEYFDKGSLATVGRNRAVGDLPKNIHIGGFFGWVTWLFVHLLYLVGFRNKLMVVTDWIWNYISFDRRVRLIIRPFSKKARAAEQAPEPAPPTPVQQTVQAVAAAADTTAQAVATPAANGHK